MLPGTDSLGVTAEIRNLRDTLRFVVPMVEGGFDPVAVPAEPGDTLRVEVTRRTGGRVVSYGRVPGRSRPIVVRVSPPNRRTQVPLNSIVRVVFSEAMDSAAAVGAVTLSANGQAVPAVLELTKGTEAVVSPESLLAPAASYQVDVATAAVSLAGEALTAPVRSEFTTLDPQHPPPPPPPPVADTTAPVVLLLDPAPGDTLPVDFAWFRVDASDAGGLDYLYLDAVDTLSGNRTELFWGEWWWLTEPAMPLPQYYVMPPGLPAGTYVLRVSSSDHAMNLGAATPVTVTLVEGDTTARLQVQSFVVMEWQDPSIPGWFFYSPRLTVMGLAGQGPVQVLGFRFLDVPGVSLEPAVLIPAYSGPLVEAGQPVEIAGERGGRWEIEWGIGGRYQGGVIHARLVFRDLAGHIYATTLTANAVTPGRPTTFTAETCRRWFYWSSEGSCLTATGAPPP